MFRKEFVFVFDFEEFIREIDIVINNETRKEGNRVNKNRNKITFFLALRISYYFFENETH